MYEKHFGLAKRPFPDRVFGDDIFVGPETAGAVAGLKKALTHPDAVVAVSGPAGVGKTTLVTKTLEALGPLYKAIPIGRMHLNDSDVLEYLLKALGVSNLPNGAIRRFMALRKVLAAIQAQNMRAVVIVEDAVRLGLDTLAELEALTAADAGPSAGANLLLMGNDSLGKHMQDPQLERLIQRLRHRHRVEPMSAPELHGYLKHSLRQSGGDFESIFDKDAVERLASLGGGIPRVVNNLVKAALSAVAREDEKRVSAARIASVASDEFGLELSEPPIDTEEPRLVIEAGIVAEPAVTAVPPVEVEPEAAPQPVAEEPVQRDPVIVFSDEALADDEDHAGERIPELIRDTLPDLENLAPEIMTAEASAETEDEMLPTLEVEPEPLPEIAAESEPDDVPDWERDPTLAQLKPDLDALEQAMAFDAEVADQNEPIEIAVTEVRKPMIEPEEIPEITLDDAIKQGIENNLIDEPGQVSSSGHQAARASSASDDLPDIKIATARTKNADAELERITSELAKAKTIEHVDGMMVETLFGDEINLVASHLIANGYTAEPANDAELCNFDTGSANGSQAAGIPAGTANGSVEVSLEAPRGFGDAGLDLSASQRLKIVRALSADPRLSMNKSGSLISNGAGESLRNHTTPASIEDQINTSMTQTLKALDVHPPLLDREELLILDDDDENQEQKKSGFFNRFRRS
jgi:type II secretory pathway predicted ATPase ExeA